MGFSSMRQRTRHRLKVGPALSDVGDYLLDQVYAYTYGAYSLRRLRYAYTGPCLRVRRSSDNAETDIGFAGALIDQAALLAFVGANDGFVTLWYDQSVGPTLNSLPQPTAAAQPQIVAAGVVVAFTGTMPGIKCDGVARFFRSNGGPTLAQPSSVSSVLKFVSVASGQNVYSDNATSSMYFNAAGSLAMYAGATAVIKTGIVANDIATVMDIKSGASSVGSYNGTAVTLNPSTLSAARIPLGASWNGAAGSVFASIVCPEFLIYTKALSVTERQAIEQSQKNFWGTP